MSIRLLILSSFLSLGLCSQAFSMPLHFAIPADVNAPEAPCVFPDGTSPGAPIHCYSPAQFMQAYGIDKLHQMGLTGKGQTIVLVDSYGSPTAQQDLDHFSDVFGLPHTKIQFVYPDGPYTNPLTTDDEVGWAGETTLDLEWAHAIAPDATIVNVISNSDETVGMNGMQDLFDGMRMASQKYPGAIISMSFAAGENTFTADDVKNSLRGTLHQVFADATATGSTLLAGAGDTGSVNVDATQKGFQSKPDTNFPASDPLVTAVGGTALEVGWRWDPEGSADDYWMCQILGQGDCGKFLNSTLTPGQTVESLWKEDWAGAAGGGGVSSVFTTPDFQAGLPAAVRKIANGYRTIPDLSMNAAINGGVEVYASYVAPNQKTKPAPWQTIGGTSCATPETAALVALAGEQASNTLGKQVTIGDLNEILYSLPGQDFNDILPQTFGTQNQVTLDNNALYFNTTLYSAEMNNGMKPTVPPVAVPGYSVTSGYDLATGLGSPKAESFVMDVAAARVSQEHRVVMP